MQTEEFDDKVRRKLLDLDQVTSEEEIDRIHRHVFAGGKSRPGAGWLKIFGLGMAAAFLAGSLCLNYYQGRENSGLLTRIDSLRARIEKTQAETYAARQPEVRVVTRTDTVYIDRYRDRYFSSLQAYKSLLAAYDKGYTSVPDSPESAGNEVTKDQPDSWSAPIGQETPELLPAGSQLQLGSLSYLYNRNSFRTHQVSLTGPQIGLPRSKQAVATAETPSAPRRVHGPGWRPGFLAGAGFDAGNDYAGVSVLGELKISPHWSLQTGFRWKQVAGPSYYTADQYQQQTGLDFRSLYAPYVAENTDLINIEQSSQLFQIPLMIAYHHKLNPVWGLYFGLGSDLNVGAAGYMYFDYRESSLSFVQGRHRSALEAPAFDAIAFNAGVERSWKKFLFRLTPYASQTVRSTAFNKDGLSFGARLQVHYKVK